jgi:hypothetical protein
LSRHRDDLGAAQDRIRALEERVKELEKEPEKKPPARGAASPFGSAPSWRDLGISMGGAAATALVSFGASVYVLSSTRESYPIATFFIAVVATAVLMVALPRAFVPIPFLVTRDEHGSYDRGFRWKRPVWITISLIALVIHAGALIVLRPG